MSRILNFVRSFSSKKKFINYSSHILYRLNTFLCNYKVKKSTDFEKNKYQVCKIDLSEDELRKIDLDLKIKENIFEEKSSKYILYDYPKDFLKTINLAWGFDRRYYTELFKKKLDPKIKEVFGDINFRIEHVWMYETPAYSKNINENFHYDSDESGGIKCLIYVTDVDEASGPFAIQDMETGEHKKICGKSGTVVFFDQCNLLHSNSKNDDKKRIVFSFTIYPTLRKNIMYQKTKPLNSHHALNPFTSIS